LNLHEAAEAREATSDDCRRDFAKARAVGAVWFASIGNPESAADCLYEAAAAVGDDKEELFTLIDAMLKRAPSEDQP